MGQAALPDGSTPPRVSLGVSLAHANHLRACYNMLLAAMVVVLLLGFVALLNTSIWKVGPPGVPDLLKTNSINLPNGNLVFDSLVCTVCSNKALREAPRWWCCSARERATCTLCAVAPGCRCLKGFQGGLLPLPIPLED